MKKVYTEHSSFAEYEALEQDRLQATELEDGQLLHLLMRCRAIGAEALRAPVYIQKLRRSDTYTLFDVVYTNRDLQPVTRGHTSRTLDDYWVPDEPLPLHSAKVRGLVHEGFFLPYESALDDELWTLQQELLVPVHTTHSLTSS